MMADGSFIIDINLQDTSATYLFRISGKSAVNFDYPMYHNGFVSGTFSGSISDTLGLGIYVSQSRTGYWEMRKQ